MNGNNQNKKEDESSSSIRNELSDNVMKKGGAGNRNRTGMGIATRRILSPVRLPVALKSAFLL
ncbi:MAG: hypothetical protein PWQ60_2043, partial [Thermoanaerobacteraceae bacterium]|nr:hypothetical protein [Thermoanaerobacteraceae bacterium]